MRIGIWRAVLLATLLTSRVAFPASPEHNPVAREPTVAEAGTRIHVIVKLRPDAGLANARKLTGQDRAADLAKRSGFVVARQREISPELIASQFDIGPMQPESALARLQADAAVEYVTPDRRRFIHAVPNDPLFSNQWYLGSNEVSAVNAVSAWDRELGSTGVVVAVLDTGVLFDHPDLGRAGNGGKLLPGYDFVSGPRSNDGNDWDADPSDPGDWLEDSDRSNAELSGCSTSSSSWHGTRVSGMVGALTNNSVGIAGLGWNVWVLPVRVLGKCGGRDSDILAGMRWAAGIHVAGVPDNTTPARIINASFGSMGSCPPSYQSVIQELAARKVLVVVSAGNEGGPVGTPANCPGVVGVAALRHAGTKVGFSSLGPEVTLGAPGGNCVNVNGGPCLFSLDTTSNSGSQGPQSHIFTSQTNPNLGTSFSAPIVSAIAALMVSRNANLSSAQLAARLREGALAYPATSTDPQVGMCHEPTGPGDVQLAECLCTTATCGAGLANASNSVAAASRPIAALALPASVSPGQNVTLNATGSAAACNRTVASYAWTVVAPTTNPPTIANPTSATASVVAPTSGSVTVRVTVTDDQGRTDTADAVLTSSSVTSSAPATAGTTA